MKRLLSLILCVSLFVSLTGMNVLANEKIENVKYQEYITLVKQGILDEEVSFEYWSELKERELELLTYLETSEDFECVYDSTRSASSYSMRKGDIFVTNGTNSAVTAFLGHAAIAVSSSSILHIAGVGETPDELSLSDWHSEYTANGWTRIYRHSSSTVASDAGQWAADTYRNSGATYNITMDLTTTHETYCSKIVWQAYYYGPDTVCANGSTTGVRLPFELDVTIKNVSLVHTEEG